MHNARGDEPRNPGSDLALRTFMRRLREIMAETDDGQRRLDNIVRQVAGHMVADVCSIYLKRQDGSLELFATEGLNPTAVHNTFMKRGEGLVGRCAELAQPVNEADAQNHPAFSYRPETGEESYHSLLAVPIKRGGYVLGVLVVQNRTHREFLDDDVEVLETTAMVLAEYLVSGDVARVNTDEEFSRQRPHTVRGQAISDGLGLGHVVLHDSTVVVVELKGADVEQETGRLEAAVEELKQNLDELVEQLDPGGSGEHKDVLEAYRMFAHDRGWLKRMRDAIKHGMSAEAAVARVKNDTRARMSVLTDEYLRERLRDLDELSDRLLRVLTGRSRSTAASRQLPVDAVIVARSMGPADLLDYDRSRVKGLVIEDSSGQSHLAIVAKAMGIAAVGQVRGVMERVDEGDPIIVDAEMGEVYIRPSTEVIASYADKARFRARKQRKYRALKDTPAVTRDGQSIALNVNAGLLVDVAQMQEAGADGIGLFRTELQFMISRSLPRLERQTQMYREVLREAGDKPVTFRLLDVGGDKALPYLRQPQEENPAMGWRAIRMSLDRKGLLVTQVRALLRATAGSELRLLVPMVTTIEEFDAARAVIHREIELQRRRNGRLPAKVSLGVMLEVPSLLFQLDVLLPKVDFVSVGSNDLMQYLNAADRNNERVSDRYDPLLLPNVRVFDVIATAAHRHGKSLTLCGEMAGRPLEALVLLALGYRSLSMSPASLGPVKAMMLSLDVGAAERRVRQLLEAGVFSLRQPLMDFVAAAGVEV